VFVGAEVLRGAFVDDLALIDERPRTPPTVAFAKPSVIPSKAPAGRVVEGQHSATITAALRRRACGALLRVTEFRVTELRVTEFG